MITPEMIAQGYSSGLITLMMSPHDDGVVCTIGDCWFYFGGHTAEECGSVEEYKKDIPEECIVKDIYDVLQDFWRSGHELRDEYLYYEYFLQEKGVA